MLTAIYKNKFKKDIARLKKQGKDLIKLKTVMENLIANQKLDAKFFDHSLKGEFSDCRECHIEPDWLLIYLLKDNSITFVRSGSHSDLF